MNFGKKQRASLAVSALMLGSMMCTPVFASETVDTNNAYNGGSLYVSVSHDDSTINGFGAIVTNGNYNKALNYSNVTVLNDGSKNIVQGIGAQVQSSQTTSPVVSNGSSAISNGPIYVSNVGDRNEVLGLGSQLNGGTYNIASSNGVIVTSKGNGSLPNFPEVNHIIQGIGAQVTGGSNNQAYTEGNVKVDNISVSYHQNVVVARGAVVSSVDGYNTAISKSVTAINLGEGNNVGATGAIVNGTQGTSSNTAVSNDSVYVYNYGNAAKVIGSGSAVYGGSYNTASSNGVSVTSGGSGSTFDRPNSIQAFGAEVIGGNSNKAYADYVHVESNVKTFYCDRVDNNIVARGAFVSSDGMYNTAMSKGVTVINDGVRNNITAIGAMVTKTDLKVK